MSLFKQLWLAIIFLLVLVFGGSFVVSSLSAKSYLEQQLYLKNMDNAAALALSLTQQETDPVMLELILSAQFDTGHYELIELRDPEGNIVVSRSDTGKTEEAPGWFVRLLPITVEPGFASVQSGWQQVGTLTLRSHSRFAYKELWESTQLLALVFFLAMIIAGLLGRYLLRIILRPLDGVIEQAEAIGERRFITIPEPYTTEFKRVVSAMNALSERSRSILRQEASRLEKWQRDAHLDKVTGLLNREPFMQGLATTLENDDINATGTLALIRLGGLADLNRTYGRKAVDRLLADTGAALNRIVSQHSRWAASRLNGSDFALLAPRSIDAGSVARDAQNTLLTVIENRSMEHAVALRCAATVFAPGDTVGNLMTRLDGGLASAENADTSEVRIVYAGDVQVTPVREKMQYWQTIFEQALSKQAFSLASYPVMDINRGILHYEAPVRLHWEGEQFAAGTFLPWINRLELSGELDRRVVDMALQKIAVNGQPLAVNLSVGALVEPSFLHWLGDRLGANGDIAGKLWLEVPESVAFRQLQSFKKLCVRAKAFHCKIGIEHMGHQIGALGQLHDVGLDFLKVDASFIRDIDTNPANQTLMRTLCTVGHSIGLTVIAEGVQSSAEWQELLELGIDGATGPWITENQSL
ncbi:GGDEF domain-containing protein [Kineobactrum sediminis]|uniref:GGDEF domain-containing protein n=1 Tax=Kineobactrum sediminis TaxID=1905677 RepID=A0A2N5XZM3_9GAMM|nr:EAL domain-containing protein [Kineobactrum sediminis]PLW81591.1 GGDEF domain-containing protein [Kineobactrum sediminis]